MIKGQESMLYDRAYAFAVRVVRAYQYLGQEKREFILAKQLLRSGTSIGATIAEAKGAISDAEFSAKLSMAYEECLETRYWLDLLKDTDYINERQHKGLYGEAEELGKMLFSSIRIIERYRNR